ncbi:MAG: cytochrome c1 [Gammaproteobacteria bacterium]
MKYLIIYVIAILLPLTVSAASSSEIKLAKADIDLHDKASLQRGAGFFMNYCAGCHSLQYMRYMRLAKDIGITNAQGNVDRRLVEKNLILGDSKIWDTIQIAMPKQAATQYFGIPVPDLSLVARVRGADWLYTYLTGFYRDDSRPWGANNLLVPGSAMPNVLYELQGEQVPQFVTKTVKLEDGTTEQIQKINRLVLSHHGLMDLPHFDATINDVVNFLVYVGEPVKLVRQRLGYWVLGFLIILLIPAYLLYKDVWRDVKK